MGEFDLIARHFVRARGAQRAELGIGDDCALLAPSVPGSRLAISTDMLVEGTHFIPEVDPQALGHKALAVNLSDLAAMGARPLAYLLAIALPRVDEVWLSRFASGLHALADRFGLELVGGDTTRGPLTVAVTILGEVDPAATLRRDRAQPGDDIWVSGTLGGAALALREQRAGGDSAPGRAAQRRLDWPEPRVALGLRLAELAKDQFVHAAIYLSDGLAGDLGHILERSAGRLGATLWGGALPLDPALQGLPWGESLELALRGGDDYELAFTAPACARATIAALSIAGVPVSRVGQIEATPGLRVRDQHGNVESIAVGGYDHFPAPAPAPAPGLGVG